MEKSPGFYQGVHSPTSPVVESTHPTPASVCFTRAARRRSQAVSAVPRPTTPGPADYRKEDCTSALDQTATAFARGPRGEPFKPTSNPDAEYAMLDGNEKYAASQRAVFGRSGRDAEAMDLETARACPQHTYGRTSPGPVAYKTDDRPIRPRSAPSYSVSKAERRGASATAPPHKEVGTQYTLYKGTTGLGRQVESRKSTGRSASFSKSERFPPAAPLLGERTAETIRVEGLGEKCATTRQRRPPSASFGTSTREGNSRSRVCHLKVDRPLSAQSAQRIRHPTLPTRAEVVHYGSHPL